MLLARALLLLDPGSVLSFSTALRRAGFRRTQYNCWYLRLFDPFSHVALEEAGEIKVLLIFSHCALVHCQIAAGLDQVRGW